MNDRFETGARAAPVRSAARVPIDEEADVAIAVGRARDLAIAAGFGVPAVGAVMTAVSEVARNIVVHAGVGEVLFRLVKDGASTGLLVIARDEHPGIADLEQAMRDGYSTVAGLGLGLPSAKRLMDEFAIASAPGMGTVVTMRKWLHGADD